jgi:chaperonin cofactor prefoldin
VRLAAVSRAAMAALLTGLATGSPPSQPDPLPAPLESVTGQTSGASSTSFPLADSGPETSIPPSTGVYNNTLNVLTEPLPTSDPTGHIYLSNREREIVSLQRSIRSLEKQLTAHQEKLTEYIRDPYAPHNDNQGLLKNAPSDEVRQQIIRTRIEGLEGQIRNFQNQIEQYRRQLAELERN